MFDWNKHLKEIMDRTEFMALATVGGGGSWVCPVQFSYDERLNLYFKSMPGSRHMRYLRANPDVSLAIFSTDRFPDGAVAGLQLQGKAEILLSEKEVEIAAKHHYGRSKTETDCRSKVAEHIGESAKWNFVKITPTKIWYFDTRHFGEKRQEVPLEELLLLISPFKSV